MEVGIISMRYAKALIEYAKNKGVEEHIYRECLALSGSFSREPRLGFALGSPVIDLKEKFALICSAADGDQPSCREFSRFISLVLREKRESYLQSMCLMYIDLYRKLKNIGVGKLITAVPIDKQTEERIRKSAKHKIHAHNMEMTTVVDPSIEGGFIFDVNDYRLDASIATQIKRVKQQFIDKNKRIV